MKPKVHADACFDNPRAKIWIHFGQNSAQWMSNMETGIFTRWAVAATTVLALLVCAGSVSSATRQTVTLELSRRSRIPVSELKEAFRDCSRTQLSMNICAFREYVAVDLQLQTVLDSSRKGLSKACRLELDRGQGAWEIERDRQCEEETQDAEGGSMRPMLISDCKATATEARILSVKTWRKSHLASGCH